MKLSELTKFVFDVFHSKKIVKIILFFFGLRNFELRSNVYFDVLHRGKTKSFNAIVEIVQNMCLMFSARKK